MLTDLSRCLSTITDEFQLREWFDDLWNLIFGDSRSLAMHDSMLSLY